jgi:hypothetical protein
MNILSEKISGPQGFEEGMPPEGIARLVYLQPNRYSDEAIVIGVIVEIDGRVYLDKINSPDSYEALSCLFGGDTRGQTVFSLQVLHEHVYSRDFSLADAKSPTNILKLGPSLRVICDDVESYARELLRLSSSLFRTYRVAGECFQSVTQKQIVESLKQIIVRLNPFRGRELVRPRRIQLRDNSYIEIPISGDLTIGQPISMVTKEIGRSKTEAEAAIAKLNYAREKLNKQPIVYVYIPTSDNGIDAGKIEDSLGELQAVGRTSNVEICSENSIENLAKAVFRYENITLN